MPVPASTPFNRTKLVTLIFIALMLALALIYLEFVDQRGASKTADEDTGLPLEELPETVSLPPGATVVIGAQPQELSRAVLLPSYVIDLESGKQKEATPKSRDLWWQAMTASQRCLCPMINSGALLASLPPEAFDSADGTALAGLEYSTDGFPHSDAGGQVKPGLTLAVKTVEGNYAKVRVVEIQPGNLLKIEWRLFETKAKALPAPNPTVEVPKLLEKALNEIYKKNKVGSKQHLDQAVELAGQLDPGSLPRIRGLSRAGTLYWSLREYGTAEENLRAAVQDIDLFEGQHKTEPAAKKQVPWDVARSAYRMLGIVLRTEQRFAESVPWLEQAIERADAATPGSPNERGQKYLALASDLFELSSAQCQAQDKTAADASFARMKLECKNLQDPGRVLVCKRSDPQC